MSVATTDDRAASHRGPSWVWGAAPLIAVLLASGAWGQEVAGAPPRNDEIITQRAQSARESWWSWKPIAKCKPPAVRETDWVRSPIDQFILAKIEGAGVQHAAEASREVLIRRASFDLTGLPPTPKEIKAFLNDQSKDAWEQVIDRLLASPEYGVKWGRHWLDLVRYADTNGFERDSEKPSAWKYRDWVVDAFNQDKPYNRFIVEQLAGDELPDRDYSTLVATGYYRLGMWDDEVPDLKQAVADDMDGIVDVTARTFLGVGLGCARCHDHKGDPIPQSDYYRFAAYFAGIKPYKTAPSGGLAADHVLRMVRTDFGHADPEADYKNFHTQRAGLIAEISAIDQGATTGADAAVATFIDRAPTEGLVAYFPFEDERAATARNSAPNSTIADAKIRDAGFGAPGKLGHCFDFDGGDDRLEIDRPVQDSFTVSFWFRTTDVGGGSDSDRRWFLGKGLVDGEIPGIVRDWGISLVSNGFISAGTGDPETFVSSGPGYNDGNWHHVAFTRQQSSGRIALWMDGARVQDATGSSARLDAPATLTVGALHQPDVHAFAGGVDELRFYDRVLKDGEIRSIASGLTDPSQGAAMLAGRPAEELLRWRQMHAQLAELQPPAWQGETVLAVREQEKPRPTHVMVRGSPHTLSAKVEPGVPLIAARVVPRAVASDEAPRIHGESSGRRLALAEWIADKENVLTLRTIANRLWQHHFGVGICPTSNDLGKFGEAPSHAMILDWLATQVVANKWSLKSMHRIIMTSATYRMASTPTESGQRLDAGNELLSRFRMRRLDAEEIRDSMLFTAGTLSDEHGGPGVRPPMPDEVLATSSRPDEVWPVTDQSTWTRRSLYIQLKRSLLHPLLSSFDLADVDSPCPVRFNTIQPTQALSMFNGKLTNDIALDLARRVRTDRPASVREQLSWARELTSGCAPSKIDLEEAEAFLAELRQKDGLNDEQAMQAYCVVVFNLNEFLTIE